MTEVELSESNALRIPGRGRQSTPKLEEDLGVAEGRPDFQKRMSELLKEARLDGIRPMPIERLLSFLGNGNGSQAVGKR